nr:integrase, catalytic region, zinc finger, CCHC-type, peptidase aspartic, catalytic [Tanacetum cinerariifolium]
MQLYEALEKSMNRDHSEELAKDMAEARKKKKKSRESQKTLRGSPPHQPPPPPPPVGPSGALGSSGAFGSSQVPPPPPPPPSTNQEDLQMDEDMAPDEQAQSSDDEDIRKPAWSILSSDVPVPTNNWASALASNYSPPPKDSLLAQTGDIAMFMDWFQCHKLLTDSMDDSILRHNVSKPLPLGGPPGQVTIQSDFFFNKDFEYLRYDSKGSKPALSISKMKAAYYPDVGLEQTVPDQIWIEEECKYDIVAMYGISHWWFQRQRFYIDRHTSEGDRRAVRTHMRILSVVRIEVFSMCGYDNMKKTVLRRADLNEHVIAKQDFKYLYPSDFEDLYLLNLQGHLNHLSPKDKKILTTTVNLWTRHLVIRQRVEDFQLGIESYQTQLNLTKPRWDATHDYTVIDSPRTVTFRDRYGVQMIMRFNEIHKSSDGTLQAENDKIKQHYKELYDSIKITRAKHIEQVTALTTENVNLKAQILENVNSVSKDHVNPKVLAQRKYAIEVEPIAPRLRNNRDSHLDYLRHLKKSVETIRDIVEEAKVVRPLDRSIVFACRYTKHSQELLEYVIGTCPQDSQQRDKQLAHIPLIRKKQVTFANPSDTSNSNTHKPVAKVHTQKTNVPVPPSTRVKRCTNASGSQPRSNTKKNRISPAKGVNKLPVEEQSRTNKSLLRTSNRVDSSSRIKRTVINSNSDSICQRCNKCLIFSNHDICVVDYLQSVVATPFIRHNCDVGRKVKQVWKPTQVRQVVQIVLWYLDSGCSKYMTGDRSRLMNFVKKFIGTVRFGNDHFGAIMGYGDYVIGDIVISRVYYVEGLGHNLFSVGQICDSDLEVAFRKHSFYVRDTDDVELIKGSRGSNLYTISKKLNRTK